MTTNAVLAIKINFQRIYCDDLEQLTIPLWARIVIKISHLLLGVSSASNIIIYSYQVINHHHHHHHHHHHQDFNFRTVLARICPLKMTTISSFVQCTVTTSQLKGLSDLYDCDDDPHPEDDDPDDIVMVDNWTYLV